MLQSSLDVAVRLLLHQKGLPVGALRQLGRCGRSMVRWKALAAAVAVVREMSGRLFYGCATKASSKSKKGPKRKNHRAPEFCLNFFELPFVTTKMVGSESSVLCEECGGSCD